MRKKKEKWVYIVMEGTTPQAVYRLKKDAEAHVADNELAREESSLVEKAWIQDCIFIEEPISSYF